jgi:Flp pilus assembly protein TadG
MLRRFGRETGGQSLVEVALALPILLLLVLGIADLGRFGFYSIAVTQAARDGAAFAAKNPMATTTMVHSRVCAEVQFGGPQCATVTVDCTRGGESCDTRRPASSVQVQVRFALPLITGIIAERVGMRTIPLRGEATVPGYTQ